MKKISYKTAGVDIKRADQFARNIKAKGLGAAFGSLFNLEAILKAYKSPVLVSSADGVGTKLKIAQEFGVHNTVGIDLVAMNVNDIVCLGAKPLFFLDYIGCGKLNVGVLTKVMKGIQVGLRDSGCKLIGGETAEMPGMYKPNEYDLAGFCVGIVNKKNIIDGRKIREGDLIIGLSSNGLHSNGFSLVRKAFSRRDLKNHAKELLRPTRIYVKPILSLLKNNFAIKAIAHNTGGAFYNKITKVLPKGYGMVIDKDSWRVPRIFKVIQQKSASSDKEMYSVFNMGIGMILVVDKNHASKAKRFIDRSCGTHLIGQIIKSKKRMNIV